MQRVLTWWPLGPSLLASLRRWAAELLVCSAHPLIQTSDVLRCGRSSLSPAFSISGQPKCETRKQLRQTEAGTPIDDVTKSNLYIPTVLTRGQQRFTRGSQYTLTNTGFNVEPVCVDLTLRTGKTLPRRNQPLYPAEYFNTTAVAVFTQWIRHSEQQKETYFTKNQQQMCGMKVTSSRKQLNVYSSSTRLDHDTWTMT